MCHHLTDLHTDLHKKPWQPAQIANSVRIVMRERKQFFDSEPKLPKVEENRSTNRIAIYSFVSMAT